jgi:tetratricopeptide (TPR) repeat protein
MSKALVPILCLFAASLVGGCNSSGFNRSDEVPSSLDADEVADAITSAEAALVEGRPQLALDWMRTAAELRQMPREQRNRVQHLLEISADQFIKRLGEDADPESLADFLDLGLPRQIAVTGAMQAAALYLARGKYTAAKSLIQKIDQQFPTHHLRPEAGGILVEAGLRLSEHKAAWLIFSKRDDALAALEYSSIHYPQAQGGDLVLRRLAEMYEEDSLWALAIDRHEELVQSFPRSPLVPFSLARIPHLRLASIASPEYDREALQSARDELERWLEDNAGHEVTDTVIADLEDALHRLGESDLVIAKFYRAIDLDYGQRFHARRGLAEGLAAGDTHQTSTAQALLDELPAEAALAGEATP